MRIGIAGPILTESLREYLDLPANYPKGLGGINVNNIIIGLLRLGHHVSVYTLDVDAKRLVELSGKQLKIYIGEYRKSGRSRMLDCFRKEFTQIERFIRMDNPDIVNAHWGYEFAIGTIRSGFPHLITLHDVPIEILKLKKDLYRFIRLVMSYWVMKNGTNFSVNSIYLAERSKGFGMRLPVIPESILKKYISQVPKRLPQGKIKIVSLLTGWGEIKNPQPALKAFAKIRREFGNAIEYHLFGPGYEHNGVGHIWTKEKGMLDGVFFHGPSPYEDLMNQLADYDLLVHPSQEESFGMPLIEAMAKGLPVIGGENSGAVPWVLDYGKFGVLVDVTSPEGIATAIQKVINTKDLYERLSAEGIDYVRNNFCEDRIANKYLELYERVLNS